MYSLSRHKCSAIMESFKMVTNSLALEGLTSCRHALSSKNMAT